MRRRFVAAVTTLLFPIVGSIVVPMAAQAATAGDTVDIFGGAANAVEYDENVVIKNSGTAQAPITF